eukprot:TRINITY_DN11550_c0_g1_i1.p1 TRINITY_DN11550_c0_g1~~TRINITY_DN11550_c0_g1_i1.p1  ORF type:complete len:389 (-),score=101.27 TRINITY_DN11550_c0_g1_i1:192-1337(-)
MAEVLNLVKEGDLDGVSKLFSKYDIKLDPEEEVGEASMLRCDVFGKSYWSGGMSALLWAIEAEQNNTQMCSLLLSHYPDLLHHPDSEGATPLHYASLNGNLELVKFLLEKKSKMLLDFNGETPLHLACLNGHALVVSALLKAGAEVNVLSSSGDSPLHLATINGHPEAIRELLSHPGINRNQKTKKGETAYDIALKGKSQQVIDAFDDVKRERVVKAKRLEEDFGEQEKEKERLLALIAQDEKQFAEVQAKIAAVKQEHLLVKQKLSSFSANDFSVDPSLLAEQEAEEEASLQRQLEEQRRRNNELEESLSDAQSRAMTQRLEIKHKVASAHEALSNILSLVDSYTPVIITTKTVVESVKPHLKVPDNNRVPENDAMDTEF